MALHRESDVVGELDGVQRAEGAVLGVAPRAPRDLRDLGRRQPAHAKAVELAQRREGHVIDVHDEAHAHRVGGDEEVDLPRLVHGDLGVAGARRQRAEHHRRTAATTTQAIGEVIDLGGGERR